MSPNVTEQIQVSPDCQLRRSTIHRRLVILFLFVGVLITLGYHHSSAKSTSDAAAAPIVDPPERHQLSISRSLTANLPEPPQAGSTQVSINFDDVAPFTDVSARYPIIRFSSPGLVIYPYPASFPRSAPNALTRGTGFANVFNRHFADLIIDFTQPVNNLKFYITEGDSFGTVAFYDYYQNGVLSQSNIPIGGPGPSHIPIPIEFQSSITNITKVTIHNITDGAGLSFDDFTFSVPAPTPTPTPTPTPPPIPTGLKGVPDENSAQLTWAPSTGAVKYVLTRTGDTCSNDASSAAEFQAAVPDTDQTSLSTAITVDSTGTVDTNLCADHTYIYTVAAVGSNGLVSGNSDPVSVTPSANGCSGKAIARPNASGSRIHVSKHGWSMDYEVTDGDGLVLYDIFLNGRRMAARFSVPYFMIEAFTDGQSSISRRGELRPDGTSSNFDKALRSRLVAFEPHTGSDTPYLELKATYAIDHIPGAQKACLNITQQYQFFPEGFGYPSDWPGPCEPSGEAVHCAKFRPMVTYNFESPDSREHFVGISIPQRQHYEVSSLREAKPNNSVGLFKDYDDWKKAVGHASGFVQLRNPLEEEDSALAVDRGLGKEFDNFHETWKSKVKEPPIKFTVTGIAPTIPWFYIGAGCLECVHMHWRWGAFFDYEPFGGGYPILPPRPGGGNFQSLDIAAVRQHNGEEHPDNYTNLLNTQREVLNSNETPGPVVFWYVPIGYTPHDTFFWQTAWFNAIDPDKSAITKSITASEFAGVSGDGPTSINLGDVFVPGDNHIEPYDLNTLPPLPPGYVALDNSAYKITTDALSSGQYIVGFGAASINDQSTFQNLRIFHVEPDQFDPEKPTWVDSTILAPNSPAPDFSTRTVSSLSEELGVFAIGSLVQTVPPSSDSADLSVSCTDSSDPIVAENQLTYTMTVTNNGPQAAHEVALRDVLHGEVGYVSSTPSQGTCKIVDSTMYVVNP